MATKNRGGIVTDQVVPGGFYQGALPGGITDATTGLNVPGPRMKWVGEGKNKKPVIAFLPDPMQMPTHKRIMDYKDRDRKVRELSVVPFDRGDDYDFVGFFNDCLACGVIRHVPDEEVKESYPNAWAERKDQIIFEINAPEGPGLAELVQEFQQSSEHTAAHAREVAAREVIQETTPRKAAARASAPPPPPPPAS